MPFRFLPRKVATFLASRGKTRIERHQIFVYLLHAATVIIMIGTQLVGWSGSQEPLPKLLSALHLGTCLTMLLLWAYRKLSIPVALSLVSLVAQAIIVARLFYFVHTRPEQFMQFILLNQITSLLAVVFLVMCFVRYTPFIVSLISLTAYGSIVVHLKEPGLWQLFNFFFGAQFFLCVLGELLYRNVRFVQAENTDLHHRKAALMHAVRLNEQEIEAYLRMSSNSSPTSEDTDHLFTMLKPSSQRNIINAVRLHLRNHLTDDCNLAELFPVLSKSEVLVCNLILQGKKRSEISRLLNKSEKNIDVVRTHVRKKLNVPEEQELGTYLTELLADKWLQPMKS